MLTVLFTPYWSIGADPTQVYGRGGQAVLAWCSWRVFALHVTTSMESAPVTYSSFRAIFLESGPSVYSIGRLIRDFVARKGLQSKLAMIFVVISMIYILLFPTLASAMTGYTGFVKAYVPDYQDENYIRFDQFKPLVYVIRDGQRVGLTEDFLLVDETTTGRSNIDSNDHRLR